MLLDGKQLKNASISNAKLATPSGNPTKNDKGMAASLTSADNQIACATGITATPASGSFVTINVNGIQQILGDGVKTKDCYFSGDSGTTARAINAIIATDKLYWNGSIAGFQLATTDFIDFNYVV